jgi:hypothetical protein
MHVRSAEKTTVIGDGSRELCVDWINLMSLMLKDYKEQGRYVTMDLA